ncbi:MAG TPA: hypothetical protein VMC79_01845 [Rectinemataceae bacterium]|nr:hypothetical protein [Rectinemataceae bacterium]
MPEGFRRRRAAIAVALSLGLGALLAAQGLDLGAAPSPTDSAAIADLPSVGLWMLNGSGSIAHWLGEKVRGKTLQEPINVIIVDGVSRTETEAIARLEAACEKSEFEKRIGHSGGYQAYIGGMLFDQIPRDKLKAFSDGPFEFSNNHGRLFGPAPLKAGYLFTGAFSREHANIMTKTKHLFSSFNQARDAFARAMERSGYYEVAGFAALGSAIVDSTEFTTMDHDGVAVLLRALPVPIRPAPRPSPPEATPDAAPSGIPPPPAAPWSLYPGLPSR